MPNDLFMWFILLWSILVFVFVAIGGYFMFRKFLKKTPKEDGKSILDWQDYYINETLHLQTDEQKKFLNELVEPVPELFRDVAKGKIAGKIGELALENNAEEINGGVKVTIEYIQLIFNFLFKNRQKSFFCFFLF